MQVWIVYVEAEDENGPSIEVFATEQGARNEEAAYLTDWRAANPDELDGPMVFVWEREVQS